MNTDGSIQPNAEHQIPSERDTRPRGARPSFWESAKEWVRVIVIAMVIAIPIRFFIAEPFIVSGASMDPTFSTGQFLVIDRMSYRFGEPRRGDVIVFEYPYDRLPNGERNTTYYIKRIIGLPGERVRMSDGKVTIETASSTEKLALEEPYVQPYHRSHESMAFPENGKFLGTDQYIVMGDNRAESSDSRVWGPLGKNYIVGRPIIRLTPLTAISILPGQYHEATTTK